MLAGDGYAQQTPASTPAATPPAPAATAATTPKAATTAKAPVKKTATAAKPATAAPALTTRTQKFSYALGMYLGGGNAQMLKKQAVDFDPALVGQGVKDAMAGGKTRLTEEEMKAVLTEVQNEKTQEVANKNKSEGDAFLAANKGKEGVVTLPSGLQYKILTAGTGAKPTASESVVCNYRGTLVNGTEFDSSYKRGQPATFPVTGVIKGWTEALQLMPVGSKWQLFVPSSLAYGENGQPRGGIGPNTALLFEVELISIEKPKEDKKADDKQELKNDEPKKDEPKK